MNRSDKSLLAPPWLLLIIGVISLLTPMLFLTYQLRSPSDGARISKRPDAITSRGIRVHVLSEQTSLQEGDLVIAVQGINMNTWTAMLWLPGDELARWNEGETVQYRVQRGDRVLDVPVVLGSQPVAAILAENWGVLLFALVFQLVGVFILFQRPREPAAQALFLWGILSGHFYVWSSYLQVYDLVNSFGFWFYWIAASFLWLTHWPAALQLALTFPKPLPAVQHRPWLIWSGYPVSYLTYGLFLAFSRWQSASLLDWVGQWFRGDVLVGIVFFIPALLIIGRQYRLHQHGPDRQKIQWVVFSGIFSGSLAVFLYLVPEFLGLPSLGVNAMGVLLLPFPLAIAIAIWRYHLFDINLIINRTLVYGSLTATLTLLFIASITILQFLFTRLTGERSAVATIISTLLIAALFNPLRKRIQTDIDRRFYRQKYNAEQIVSEFGVRLREQVDLDEMCTHLLEVVERALQPEHVSLWLLSSKNKVDSSPPGDDG